MSNIDTLVKELDETMTDSIIECLSKLSKEQIEDFTKSLKSNSYKKRKHLIDLIDRSVKR